MHLYSKFRFNKVGQGLFYTGHIHVDKAHFFMCYDCGTESNHKYIEKEIDDFCELVQDFNRNQLDLLFISHFDNDHISHISKLLQKVKCHTVVLPYIKPGDRLILYLENDSAGNNDAYMSFLIDPIGYLIELGVKRIILVDDSGSDNDEFIIEEQPLDPDNKNINLLQLEIRLDDSEGLKTLIKKLESVSLESDLKAKVEIYHKNHTGILSIRGVWKFILFNVKITDDKKNKLINEIELKLNHGNEINKIALADILHHKFEELKIIYKDKIGKGEKSNNSSLVVYHEPIVLADPDKKLMHLLDKRDRYICLPICLLFSEYLVRPNLLGTTLNADIDMNKYYHAYKKYFSKYLKRNGVYQIPHHGSSKNWERKIIKDLDDIVCYLINYGLGNRHKHPSNNVVNDLLHSHILRLNNQLEEFDYTIVGTI
ncbi:MAG: hypothetical protein KJ571_07130 [Bacteroidetes bacterium]|nr:hypothetical protein [Bacteroidota bacterium]